MGDNIVFRNRYHCNNVCYAEISPQNELLVTKKSLAAETEKSSISRAVKCKSDLKKIFILFAKLQ